MPWGLSLKADIRRFRSLTLGKSVIMGRRTYDSMMRRPLPDRENIVVTSAHELGGSVTVARSLEEAYERAGNTPIVIGGAALYLAALEYTDIIFATEIDAHFPEADIFFPEIPESLFTEAPGARQHQSPDTPGGYSYDFTIYLRSLKDNIEYESFV